MERIDFLRKRLKAIEKRHEAVERRQENIDKLAYATMAAATFLLARIRIRQSLFSLVENVEKSETNRRRASI